MDILYNLNAFAWVASNLLVGYTAAVLVVFVITYFIFFNPWATTAGKMIFQFMISLVGVISLVFVGTFIDPAATREWFIYPGDVASWRPLIRLIIYAFVAYSVTSLAFLLAIRKWKPQWIKTSADYNLVQLRHTGENPTINK